MAQVLASTLDVFNEKSDMSVVTATAIEMPTTGGDEVRILGIDEYKAAAATLADAFADDDVMRYFLDTPDTAHWTKEEKWDLHVKSLEYITYAHCMKGLVLSAGPDHDCVSLWYVVRSMLLSLIDNRRMPPGENMDDLLTILRSGLWRLNYQLSAEGRARFFSEFLPLLHDTKARILGPRDDEVWYLVYIGTKSSSRGKGYARKVVDFVTNKADSEGRACYLESSHAINKVIYGKLGFELKKNIWLQRAEENISLDIMVREPKKSRERL